MKKNNKKGFTIVELVIVIAVIAILAAVMIPTFGGIIKTANESGAMQKVSAAYKEAYALAFKDGKIDNGELSVADVYTFKFTVDANGAVTGCTVCTATNTGYNYTYAAGKWTAAQVTTSTNVHTGTSETACSICDQKN